MRPPFRRFGFPPARSTGAPIPPHRITRLRRQGERYFADGLRELPDNRRLAILAVCAAEWELFLAAAVVGGRPGGRRGRRRPGRPGPRGPGRGDRGRAGPRLTHKAGYGSRP